MQGTDWTRKFDSTPPTPATSVLPAEVGRRERWEGRMCGREEGEATL